MITENDLVLDIECASWTEYVVGALGSLTTDEIYVTADEDLLVEKILAQSGHQIWAHFGGHYDFMWLLDKIDRRGIEWHAAMAGTSPVSITIGDPRDKKGRIVLRDSFRLWPSGLATIGKLLCRCCTCGEKRGSNKCVCSCSCGMRKSELPPALREGCDCGMKCGGYCQIKRCPEHVQLLTPYLHQDVRVLRHVLRWLADLCAQHSIPLRATVGGTAWADARTMLSLPVARDCLTLDMAKKLRAAYYGGRVEVFRLAAAEVHEQDVHSMYPWALSSAPVPIGRPKRHRDPLSTDLDGIVDAIILVPPTDLPPLPTRIMTAKAKRSEIDTRAGRAATGGSLAYVYGRLEGSWTTHELRAAIARGTKVLRSHGGMIYPTDQCEDFSGWLHDRAALRTRYGYDSPEAAWIKWLVNSLTGKFAQRPESSEIGTEEPKCRCPYIDCVCKEALTADARWWVAFKESLPASGHIGAAATLTARARVELLEQLEHAGDGRVYCDTDSVYSLWPLTRRLGDEVGEWGQEGPLYDWEAAAPKVYRVGQKARCKGAKLTTPEKWAAFVSGDGVPRAGVRQLSGVVRKIRSDGGGALFQADSGTRAWLGRDRPLVGSREKDGQVTRSVSIDRYLELRAASDKAARDAAKQRAVRAWRAK